MEAVVKKWGNSLGIRIPNAIARELSLKDGSFIDINDKGKEIIIKPIQKNKLSEMLSKVNEQMSTTSRNVPCLRSVEMSPIGSCYVLDFLIFYIC